MSLETDGIPANDDELRAKLVQETGRIGWHELQRFYARGNVVRVAADQDLIEVGVALVRDRKDEFQQWISDGKIAEVKPDEAQRLHDEEASVWALVVAPWVLVQPDREA